MTRQRSLNIKLSRLKGGKPKLSMLSHEQLALNIADGILYAKCIDTDGNPVIVPVGGKQYEKIQDMQSVIIFETQHQMQDYLTDSRRSPGQIATCLENQAELFVLSGDRSEWLRVKGETDKHFKFHVTHTLEEIIEHNLGKKPAVQILGQNNDKCIADVEHISENQTKISWLDYFTGTIIFN